MEGFENRRRRALALTGAALAGVLLIAAIYLHPAAQPSAPTRDGAPSPSEPTVLYASFGDAQHGVVVIGAAARPPSLAYLTADGGRTWKQVSTRTAISADAIFVTSRLVIVAEMLGGGGNTNRISYDSGVTWRRMVDPRQGAGRYPFPSFTDREHGWWVDRESQNPAAPSRSWLWKTTDGGATWQRLTSAGITEDMLLFQPVFIDPRHGVMADLVPGGTRSLSLLITSDGGDSWRQTELADPALPGTYIVTTVLIPHNGRILAWQLRGLLQASDGGGFIPTPDRSVGAVGFMSVSVDFGQTWSAPRRGPDTPGTAFPVPWPDKAGRLLLVDGHRLWSSDDEGATWTVRIMQMPNGLAADTLVGAMDDVWYATAVRSGAVNPYTAGPLRALVRSTDGGAHWSLVAVPRMPTR